MRLRHLTLTASCCLIASTLATAQSVAISVDASAETGPLKPVWSFFGYDEPNYTYMEGGTKLLSELAALGPATVHVRVHNLLTSGDGTAALKWGSTNAYTEDENDRPVYDWTIVDRIFDTYIERGMKPLVEVGFMPEALSTNPEPYRHYWTPDQPYGNVYTGWSYPPRDYEKWAELVYRWAQHSAERYGREEAASWYWEVWNEPDIQYWQGTAEEYHKLYDYTADAIKRALPEARVGGPHSTGPSGRSAAFLRDFLEHVVRGTNYATGETGSPIDYIGFHAKGRPRVVDDHVQMGIEFQLRAIDQGFEIVDGFPELRHLPIIIGESDPEGCAACSVEYNPQNAYRNGTMYSSYTAATFSRLFELASLRGVDLEGAVTWAFEFEEQPYFAGFRDLATNGIDKPVLNVFRMFGMMAPQQLEAASTATVPLETVLASGVKAAPDVGALASRSDRSITVMVWNYHDDDLPGPSAQIGTVIRNLQPAPERVLLEHFRVDERHSNSYTLWQEMGSPRDPTPDEYGRLEAAGQLMLLESPRWLSPSEGELELDFELPRQGVSLLRLTW